MSKREEIRAKKRKERQRNLLTAAFVIGGIAVIVTAVIIYRNQSLINSIVIPEFLNYTETDGTAMGDPDAPIQIVEFSDFQCPACQFFHDNTLPQLIDEYIATGVVYYEYRNFPIIDSRSATKESQAAALASMCAAEQGQFWQYHDILFANQIGENVGGFTTVRLEAFADQLGLDTGAFNACLQDDAIREQVNLDMAAGIEAGINSTPSFLINGEVARGALPFENFVTIIESLKAGEEPTS
ncbi:MAG: DsbA family protein [Anaerolineales bacterium]